MPVALITGITGQDGSYLAEWLLARGYTVHGVVRPGRPGLPRWLSAIADRLTLHSAGLLDRPAVESLLVSVQPDEVYHLAARSHVGEAAADPAGVLEFNTVGTACWLDAVARRCPSARFLHASSAQIFGRPDVVPQDESTPRCPVNVYGVSKAAATDLVRVLRESDGRFAVNAILFNHESPRRPDSFVTQKICRAAAAIRAGRQSELLLGDLNPRRDWGHARDHVRGMWLALQADRPRDYILATGVTHRVQDWVEAAFAHVGLDWRQHVRQDPQFLRAADPAELVGDASRAARELGWHPEVSFGELVAEMVSSAQESFSGDT